MATVAAWSPGAVPPVARRAVTHRATGSVQRAVNGPSSTRISTYAVASGASFASVVPAARPATTIENSPWATSVPPARNRPRTPIPARCAA